MSNDMKRFFEDIKESKDFFLLRRLYKMPSSVLGNKQDMDEAEKEYYHLPDYFNLLMNNNLTRFITLALCDQEFCDKADVQVWRKFAFFLYDSADFKQYYHMVDDPDLLALLSGKMTLNDYFQKYGKPKSAIGIYSQYTIYKKYKRLYKHHFPEEQVDGYDVKQSKNALACVNSRLDVIKEQTIGRQQEKNSILSWVENDNYSEGSNLNNTFLYRYRLLDDFADPYSLYPGLCFQTFENLVCENRFLDIIERKLEQDAISGIPLDNAQEILGMGINIKKGLIDDWHSLAGRLGEDLVKAFDVKRAEALVSKIALLKIKRKRESSNIIPLPQSR